MIDLGSLSRTMSHWINDDSVNDDKNRRLRLGANHFLPAHYLQNAFLPSGTGSLPANVLEPVVGPLAIDPQRLLTYFLGVFQIGQSLAFWSDESVDAAAKMVETYKSIRSILDPQAANYYRLWQQPTVGERPLPADITSFPVGAIYEDRTGHDGILYAMAQANGSTTVAISLSHAAGWPTSVPAPWFVRTATQPTFSMLAGAEGTTFAVSNQTLRITFPRLDSQALLSFGHE